MKPQPTTVTDLIEAFRRSKTMFAGVRLGIFDRTPISAEQLTRELDSDRRATELLLDGCVSLGFLRREGDLYVNEPEAETYLKRDSPDTLVGYILYSNSVLWHLWAHLEDAVREGTHRWPQAFGLDGPIFSHFFRTEEARRTFLTGLHGFGMLGSSKAVSAHDLSKYKTFADLGGGTGHLALAFADRYPGSRSIVFDLAQVIPLAMEFTGGRVECIAGDFFADPLPPTDCYAVCRVLHDWSRVKIENLLAKIHESLPEGGGLLICEQLIDQDHRGPVRALMQSLSMLLCSEGQERTALEYEELCRSAGFREFHAKRTGGPVDAMLAVK